MAEPILLNLPPRDPRAELKARLDAAPLAHAEALLAGLEVLQGMHDQGVLEIARGLLGSRDKVLEIAVEQINSPNSIRGMRNLLLIVNALGAIDPDQLAAFVEPIPGAIRAMANPDPRPPGLLRLGWRFLGDGDIRRTLAAAAGLLKRVGQNLARRADRP